MRLASPSRDGYTISPGGADNETRHPWFHFGTQATNGAIQALAKEVQARIPAANDLEINDMSLEWRGRFDIIPRTAKCKGHTYNFDDDWRSPHCGHALGKSVDIKMRGQPDLAMRRLRLYFRGDKKVPIDPSNPRRSRFAPANHGNHWHLDLR